MSDVTFKSRPSKEEIIIIGVAPGSFEKWRPVGPQEALGFPWGPKDPATPQDPAM